MDAEIRKLTYVARSKDAMTGSSLPGRLGVCFGELPPYLRKENHARPAAKISDIQLESQIIELERERAENERRHREALINVREKAAQELTAALGEQQERLSRESASAVQATVAAFHQRQNEYFAEAEAAVVRLALGVAARILHREAQLDPLMLRGPVRVALEDARRNAGCVLEVSETEVEKWRQWLGDAGTPCPIELRVKEDASPGHCRLEIGASAADLSVNAQLAEIERGFFDLLQSRTPSIGDAAKVAQ